MKVLHYTFGLPPYVTGGLIKYSSDLVNEESKLGNDITLLYPGEYTLFKKTKIVSKGVENGVKIYKIVNPQLEPQFQGMRQPRDFYKACSNKDVYDNFIKNIQPDIIHIHTLMGLHKEFLELAKEYGIKIVLTTHDYFGLCPKNFLFDYKNEICYNYEKGKKCVFCNSNGYGRKQLYIRKTNVCVKLKSSKYCRGFYRKVKNGKYFIRFKNNTKVQLQSKSIPQHNELDLKKSEEYITLRNYYLDVLKLVDYYHFNSNISKNEFKKYMDIEGEVINISHNDIKDMRVKKTIEENKELRLTYLGPTLNLKGFYLLKESLDILEKNNINGWILNVYGDSENRESDNCKIIFNGTYDYKMMKNIFDNTDLLIIPSIWKETFGFIGLEAISYGVPVMVTDNVGMQDVIVNDITGFIVKSNSTAISQAIKRLINNRNLLNEINDNILKMNFQYTMDIHVRKIINLYKKVADKTINKE